MGTLSTWETKPVAEAEAESTTKAKELRNSDCKTRLYSLVSKQQVRFNQFIKQNDSWHSNISLCLLPLSLCSSFFGLLTN